MDYRTLFGNVARRPRMYLPAESWEAAVSFVCGVDAATGGLALSGFTEWLQVRLGRVSSLAFPALVAELAPGDTDRAKVDTLFACLDEFLQHRGGHPGLEGVYGAYFDLLRAEGLYDSHQQRWSPG